MGVSDGVQHVAGLEEFVGRQRRRDGRAAAEVVVLTDQELAELGADCGGVLQGGQLFETRHHRASVVTTFSRGVASLLTIPITADFILLLIRATIFPRYRLTPKHVGIAEIIASVLVLLMHELLGGYEETTAERPASGCGRDNRPQTPTRRCWMSTVVLTCAKSSTTSGMRWYCPR